MMITAAVLTYAVWSATTVQQEDPLAEYKKKLPPIGKVAPNFKTLDDKGKDFELHKTFNKKTKGTLVNFWYAH